MITELELVEVGAILNSNIVTPSFSLAQDVQNFLLDANFPFQLWDLGGGAGVTASPRMAFVSESERTDRSEDDRETLGDQLKEKVSLSV